MKYVKPLSHGCWSGFPTRFCAPRGVGFDFMRLGSLVLFAFNVFIVLGQNVLPNLRPAYAPFPTDSYFTNQWYLDQRDEGGQRVGPDLNARGAWMRTKGEGVIVALCDDGVEMTHRDLAANMRPDLSFDFELSVTNGAHRNSGAVFGTPAAGLIVAALNGEGIVGAAPGAQLASWIIYPTNTLAGRTAVTPDKLAAMFTHESNVIQVQVHNWVENPNNLRLFSQTPVESNAISNAVTFGRNGKGTVMVRPVGAANYDAEFASWFGRNANENAFISD